MAWIAWAIFCTWAIRVAVVATLFRRLGGWSYCFAYLVLVILVATGVAIMNASGMTFYSPPPINDAQRTAVWLFFFTPLGLPTLVGAPFVVVLDFVIVAIRQMARNSRP